MNQLKLPRKDYNTSKLVQELGYPVKGKNGQVWVIVPDDLDKEAQADLLALANSHDPELTDSQRNEKLLAEIRAKNKAKRNLIPLVSQFMTAYETSLLESETLRQTYARFRTWFDGLSESEQGVIVSETHAFTTINLLREPALPLLDDLYRAEFNRVLRDFVLFVYTRVAHE